jgi:hypothetical protein
MLAIQRLHNFLLPNLNSEQLIKLIKFSQSPDPGIILNPLDQRKLGEIYCMSLGKFPSGTVAVSWIFPLAIASSQGQKP